MPKKRTLPGLDFPDIRFVRVEEQFSSAEAAFQHWVADCMKSTAPTDQPPGGTMPDETNDVYNLYDLALTDRHSQPGDIEAIRVRARSGLDARMCAARHAGREGREAWMDHSRSTCESYGPAHVQWAGVVSIRAHGAEGETVLANHRISSKATSL
jgi:hypothetical protein